MTSSSCYSCKTNNSPAWCCETGRLEDVKSRRVSVCFSSYFTFSLDHFMSADFKHIRKFEQAAAGEVIHTNTAIKITLVLKESWWVFLPASEITHNTLCHPRNTWLQCQDWGYGSKNRSKHEAICPNSNINKLTGYNWTAATRDAHLDTFPPGFTATTGKEVVKELTHVLQQEL